MEGRWGRGEQADGGQSEGGRASGRLVGRPIGLTHTQQQCQTEDCRLFCALRHYKYGFEPIGVSYAAARTISVFI